MSDPISELLAVLLGDGGHYEAEYGRERAMEEAVRRHHERAAQLERVRSDVLHIYADYATELDDAQKWGEEEEQQIAAAQHAVASEMLKAVESALTPTQETPDDH